MILILGANGRLGTEFQKYFNREGIDYISTDIEELDVTKTELTKEYILNKNKLKNIKTIINCAAYTSVDGAEENTEACYKINMEVAVNLAMVALEIGADYVTYSTDFVFSNQIANYLYNDSTGLSEEDEALPLSAYAQSKYEAEVLIKQLLESNTYSSNIYILRTSWLFGKNNDNFIEKIIRKSKENDEINIADDQISSPTYAKDLAIFTWKLLKKKSPSGLYHFTNDGIVSRFDFAKYILEKIEWTGNLIPIKTSEKNLTAKRPHFSKLNCKKIKEELRENIPHWTDAVDRYLQDNNHI